MMCYNLNVHFQGQRVKLLIEECVSIAWLYRYQLIQCVSELNVFLLVKITLILVPAELTDKLRLNYSSETFLGSIMSSLQQFLYE